MKIEMNIEKKHLYVLMTVLVVFVGIVVVLAGVGDEEYDASMFHRYLMLDNIQSSDESGIEVQDSLNVQSNLAVGGGVVIEGGLTAHSITGVASLTASSITAENLISTASLSVNDVAGSVVPSGFCVFSDTQAQCPAGFTRRGEFDGRTIQGASDDIGETGGSETHSHNVNLGGTSGDNDPDHNRVQARGEDYRSSEESSWPPYRNVIVCCKD